MKKAKKEKVGLSSEQIIGLVFICQVERHLSGGQAMNLRYVPKFFSVFCPLGPRRPLESP